MCGWADMRCCIHGYLTVEVLVLLSAALKGMGNTDQDGEKRSQVQQ